MIQVRRRAISVRPPPSQRGLAVRALGGDLAAAHREDVAAVHLVAAGTARRAGGHPLDRGDLLAGEVPRLVPADVGDALEHVGEELAHGLLADDARAPRVLAERRLEDHVVGHHVQDAVHVVTVPHRVEPLDELLAVECHAGLLHLSRSTEIRPCVITKRTSSSASMRSVGLPSTASRSAASPGAMRPVSCSRPSARAAAAVAACTTAAGAMPPLTISASSGTSVPCGLSGVPASVPAAIATPARSAMRKPSRWRSATAFDFRTAYSGMPAATPPAAMACGAISVGTSATPSRAMRSHSASVRNTPCSMVVMPPSRQLAMPSLPMAWAAVRRPALRASSMAARTSSAVSWAEFGSTPGVITPPVAKILMTSAPALSCSRTALRTSSGPSASRPIMFQPWPPVMQMPLPAHSTRGPAMRPPRMASRTLS